MGHAREHGRKHRYRKERHHAHADHQRPAGVEKREVMIWMPLIMMKNGSENSAAAITGGGMIVSTATRVGWNASSARMPATTKPIRRLATPVAATSPALAVDTVMP